MFGQQSTLITSRDPKGQQTVAIFEAAYNKLRLDGRSAQILNECGDRLKNRVQQVIRDILAEDTPKVGQQWYVRYPDSPHLATVEICELSDAVVVVKETGFGPVCTFKTNELEFVKLLRHSK